MRRPAFPRLAEARLVAGYLGFWRVLDRLVRRHVLRPLQALPQPERRDAAPSQQEIAAAVNTVRIQFAGEVTAGKIAALCARVGGQIDAHNHLEQSGMGRVLGIDIVRTDKHIARELPKWTDANTALIRRTGGLCDKTAGEIGKIVSEGFAAGTRHETLAAMIEQRLGVARSRAVLIARDQTNKLNGDLTRDRQTDAGIGYYVWSTALDERVRPTHASLEGQVISWADPPPEGPPGYPIQCRCVAVPTIVDAKGARRGPVLAGAGYGETGSAILPPATIFDATKHAAGDAALRAKVAGTLASFTAAAATVAPLQAPAATVAPPIPRLDPLKSPAVRRPKKANLIAGAYLNDLRRVPQAIFDDFASKGGKVAVCNGPITNQPEFAAYKKTQPRGWTKGSTWAQVAGGYSPSDKVALAGKGRGFSASGSVVLHELGHGVDEINRFATTLSETQGFIAMRDAIMANGEFDALLDSTASYCRQAGYAGRQETFAELFACWINDPQATRKYAPSAAQYFDDLWAMRLDALRLTVASRPASVASMDPPADFWATAHFKGQTVIVFARAEAGGGLIGDAALAFKPGDPHYEIARAHASANAQAATRGRGIAAASGPVDAGAP